MANGGNLTLTAKDFSDLQIFNYLPLTIYWVKYI